MTARIRAHADVLALVLVLMLVAGGNLFWTAHEVNANTQAQRRAGELAERKICTTLAQLAALRPPAGSASANPSRAYEQRLHATLDQLGPDLGCR